LKKLAIELTSGRQEIPNDSASEIRDNMGVDRLPSKGGQALSQCSCSEGTRASDLTLMHHRRSLCAFSSSSFSSCFRSMFFCERT
jgi:hypothetical protein